MEPILSAVKLAEAYGNVSEYPAYPRAEWRISIIEEAHTLSYWDWVHAKLTEEYEDSM